MSNEVDRYASLIQLLGEIDKAWNAEANVAALAMVYIGIDTMALLACPVGEPSQKDTDFITWVDQYLKAEPASEYQYEGIDVYAARCAVLHSYGSVAKLHRKANPPRMFGYTDDGPHRKDDAGRLVIISVAVLIYDFRKAMAKFVTEIWANPELKRRVDSRMDSLLFAGLIEH